MLELTVSTVNGHTRITSNKEHSTTSMFSHDNPYERELGDVSFEIKRDETLDPFSISFEDYNNLNKEALEVLFDKNSQEYKDAGMLISLTSTFDDEVLNSVLFDQYKESKEKSYMGLAMFSVTLENDYKNRDYAFNTGEKFFQEFERIKDTFSVPEGHSREKIIDTVESIKEEYKKRVQENESLLQELTRNSKPTLVDVKESMEE